MTKASGLHTTGRVATIQGFVKTQVCGAWAQEMLTPQVWGGAPVFAVLRVPRGCRCPGSTLCEPLTRCGLAIGLIGCGSGAGGRPRARSLVPPAPPPPAPTAPECRSPGVEASGACGGWGRLQHRLGFRNTDARAAVVCPQPPSEGTPGARSLQIKVNLVQSIAEHCRVLRLAR